MKKTLTFLLFILFGAGSAFGQSGAYSSPAIGGSSGSSVTQSSVPVIWVTNGLLADYKMSPGDTVASLPDSSGSGNNATGTVGTAPTISASTAGLVCTGNGGVLLPAALNSALTIEAYVSYQSNSNTQAVNGIVFGNGNGAASNANGLALFFGSPGSNLVQGGGAVSVYGNSLRKTGGIDIMNGNAALIATMAASDHIYMNGVEPVFYFVQGASAGLQTTGVYQVCGTAAGSGLAAQTYFTGTIVRLRFFNRVLTAAEAAQDAAALAQYGQGQGFPPFLGGTEANNDQLFSLGDSILGGNGQPPWPVDFSIGAVNILEQSYQSSAEALSGQTFTSMNPLMANGILPLIRQNTLKNIFIPSLGINTDASFAVSLAYMKGQCTQVRLLGGKCLPMTVMSRTGADTTKNGFNPLIRQNWQTFADGLIDLASDPVLGADGASANATWFSDGLHPTALGQQRMAQIAARGINRLFGRKDTTSANTAVGNNIKNGRGINVQIFSAGSGSPVNEVFTTNTTAGSLLFCAMSWSSGQNLSTVTDSQTNTWTAVTAASTVASQKVQAWFTPNIVGGAETVILTFSASTTLVYVACNEYKDVATVTPLDANSPIATGTGTSLTSAAITTTQANDLLIGYAFVFGGPFITFNPGYVPSMVIRAQTASSVSTIGDQSAVAAASGYTNSITVSASATVGTGIAAFKGAAGTTTYYAFDSDVYINCNTTTNSVNIQLPTSVGMTGQTITVKNVTTSGANTCTVIPFGSETIDGAANITVANKATLVLQSKLVSLAASGTNWVQLQNN